MDRVVLGMDPHKRSATVEVMAADETILGGGRYATDREGYGAMLRYARQWPNRVWAVEGCSGIGRHIANRLLADGEQVVDVPPKLSARARVFATGQGRKTDATDAHSVALVGTRMAGLRPVAGDEQLALLRILVDRRRSLGEDHTRMVAQLHQLLLELIPGGAKKNLSAAQGKAMLAKVRPRDAAGKARRRVAAELISDLERVYRRSKDADKELKELVASTGTTLMDLHGIGPSGAARLLVEVGDITRFPNRAHFASWNSRRPHRRIVRRPGPTPAVASRQPADQPDAAHHGDRPAPQPHPGACLLRPEESLRQDVDGSDAVPQNADSPTSSTAAWSTTPSCMR
jgi:transposase